MTTRTHTNAQYEDLHVEIHDAPEALGRAASEAARETLADAIRDRGQARVVLATGNSQLPFFTALRQNGAKVDWSRVETFHMDEYLGLDEDHPASFRRFLRREVIEPLGIGTFHGIDGDPERAEDTIAAYEALLARAPIDLCCMGVGENGHLAFNDPPYADFADPEVAKVVRLDETSRSQQVGEGHFADLDAVPTHAITLTVPTLLRAARLLVIAPERRKAAAVRTALEGPIDPACPASVLRRAPHATLYLDRDSAAELS
ncbi:MAG: glucosamine-6-phosphate deaminase [Trueperaceae bacterium]|nr:glucosamine-6-phosphate deaminase [Trueperaceae bacterium]